MRRSPAILAAALGLIVTAQSGQAQDDVVELGRIHGTTPPASYYRELARNPRAFQFTRAWMRRNPRLLVTERGDAPPLVELRPRASGPAGAPRTAGPAAVGPRSVEGPVAFPLLLGIYSDTPPPAFTRDWIQAEYFDGPNSRYKTIPEFYAEISGGRVQVSGRTFDWAASSLSRATVTGGVSALGSPGQVGGFIEDLLEVADDGTVDWGAFDSDGPDGLPNSGDDDGFVDVIAVFHPDWGAECGGAGSSNRVWSHKWSLRFAPGASGSYRTLTPAAGGGNRGT